MSHSSAIFLGVNIDHVATVRQARGTQYPSPLQAALIAEQAGADGITVHLREDRRHIQDRDVQLLAENMTTRLNLEMAVTEEMLSIAEQIKPAHCCLVPEKRHEITTEGGLDVCGQQQTLKKACQRLQAAGIRVSLFIDPLQQQIAASHAVGANDVEIHTGAYAEANSQQEREQQLQQIKTAVAEAKQLGLLVNAGHGLHYHNVAEIAAIQAINELNIGHAIVARALFSGLPTAVSDMKRIMLQARQL